MIATTTTTIEDDNPLLSHVNLMVDTFIANASIEDLRSISRRLLTTGPAGILPAFLNAAHFRLTQTNASAIPNKRDLFVTESHSRRVVPAECLYEALTRARKLFGSGLGFASLGILTVIVQGTLGLRWDESGEMADVLDGVDGDITQAIQSCNEEIALGWISDYAAAANAAAELRTAVFECQDDVKRWGGEFPFERALSSLEFWEMGSEATLG
ncbi:hypothetical protein AX14_005861 [Amanita brunnescens Koide BX004]|nr:hypothetical protein AX14_005861 [Amanita brunnescens Koide BX004]